MSGSLQRLCRPDWHLIVHGNRQTRQENRVILQFVIPPTADTPTMDPRASSMAVYFGLKSSLRSLASAAASAF